MTTTHSSSGLHDIKMNSGTVIAPVAPLTWSRNLMKAAYELLAVEVFPTLRREEGGIAVCAASPGTGEHGGGVISRRGRRKMWSGLIGRHERCAIPLPADNALSLRHVIVIASVTDDGCAIFRALDLRSGTGLFDAGGVPHLSVVANGPLQLRLGNSALFALPLRDLFRGDRAAAYDEIDWPQPVPWLPDAPPEKRVDELSKLSQRSSVVSLTSVRRERAEGRGHSGVSRAGELVVEIGGVRADIDVSEIALRTGVLFGRYPRCDINCENAPMSQLVSRVHALFLTVDDRVRVFNTGSTNGVEHGGVDADGMALAKDRDTRLSLGSGDSITWRPRGRD